MITTIKTKRIENKADKPIKKQKVKKPKSKLYSNRIKAILNEIEMSQQELADIIETNPAHLSRIINGQRKCISLPIAIKIAQTLGRPVEEVFQIAKEEKVKNKYNVKTKA